MTRKILLIGIDGLRIDDALAGGWMPALGSFMGTAATARITMEVPTISGPGWSSLLTGADHAAHGVFDNSFLGHRLAGCPDLLSVAAAEHAGLTTFVATGWPPLGDPAGPGPVFAPRTESQREGRHRLVIRDGEVYGYRWADGEIGAASRLAVREAGPDASFVYLGEIDEAGHLYGGTSPEYRQAAGRVDAHLASLLHAVTVRAEAGEEWSVGVTTDHGHLDAGGHGGGEDVVRRSFFALGRSTGEAFTAPPSGLPERIEAVEVPGFMLAELRG